MIGKMTLILFILISIGNTENLDPSRFKKNFENNKKENIESGIKGEDPIKIIGKILKVRIYNDYKVFEILTDRKEIINARYYKKSTLKEGDNINLYCEEWNVMEYERCK